MKNPVAFEAQRETQGQSQRYHHLDAVRGFALLLGVFFHAAESFEPHNDGWAALDHSPSDLLAWLRFGSHSFRMELFFLIAGFFARLLILRGGTANFVKNRCQRILIPFALGWLLFYPLVVLDWMWGGLWSGRLDEFGILGNAWNLPLWKMWLQFVFSKPMLARFGLTYLWFLHQLMAVYIVMLVLRSTFGRVDFTSRTMAFVDRCVARMALWRGSVFCLSICTAPILILMSSWTIDASNDSLIPHLLPTLFYGVWFLAGWFLHRQPARLNQLAARWSWHLGMAVLLWLLFGVSKLYQIWGLTPEKLHILPQNFVWARGGYLAVYSLMMWAFVLGFLGMFARFLQSPSVWTRYLADCSYWFYLAHFPLVVALQVLISRVDLPWIIKYAFICEVSLVLLLLSYHYCVRATFVGRLLNGRRYPRQWPWNIRPET